MISQVDAINLVLTAEDNPQNVFVEAEPFDYMLMPTGNTVSAGTEGVACFVITEIVVGYIDETNFGDADKLYLQAAVRYDSSTNEMFIPFNFGGSTGHHILNPLVLNLPIWQFAISVTATTNIGNIHIKGYRVTITNL